MDHPQHATGGAWPMACQRILLGLVIFQLVIAGIIALKNQFTAAALVVTLMPLTVWYSFYYGRTFEPLMKYIALRSIRRDSNADINFAGEDLQIHRQLPHVRRESVTIDEHREEGMKFVNPSLSVP